jgi:hypothetical protein
MFPIDKKSNFFGSDKGKGCQEIISVSDIGIEQSDFTSNQIFLNDNSTFGMKKMCFGNKC